MNAHTISPEHALPEIARWVITHAVCFALWDTAHLTTGWMNSWIIQTMTRNMAKIEDKARDYAENKATALGLPPNNKFQPIYLSEVKKSLEAAYLQGAKDILALPLADRLTEDERESIIGWYNGRMDDIAKAEEKEAILYRGEINMLRVLFGDGFLNPEIGEE